MKIRTKLLLALCVLPIIILVQLGVVWFQMNDYNHRNAALQENYDAVLLTEQILVNIKNQAISLRNIVLFIDPDSIMAEMAAIKEYQTEVSQNIHLLESLPNSEDVRYIMDNLKESNNEFNAYTEQVISLARDGKNEEAIDLINSTSSLRQDEIFQSVSSIVSTFETNMKTSLSNTSRDFQRILFWSSLASIIGLIIVCGFIFRIIWSMAIRIKNVSMVMANVANGSADLNTRIEAASNDEIDDVSNSFNRMTHSLEERVKREKEQLWMKSNIAEITKTLNGINELEALSQTFLSKLAPLLEACHAVFYVRDDNEQKNEPVFKLIASYAFKERKHIHNKFGLGEGLIGQAALEKSPILLTNVPPDYIQARSGLGEAPPLNIYVLPVIYNDHVNAVVEIASFKPFTSIQQALVGEITEYLGIILENINGRIQLAQMFEESQAQLEEIQTQSEELQSQQEELRRANEELEEQTEALRQSKDEMMTQQEELEQANAELRDKAKILEAQNKQLEIANNEVIAARAELEEKARQLELSSRYKSEFLANMSHELRTPLNSLIILSKLLSDNPDGNLTEKQVEFSKTIHSSSCDLLAIINDILDLSKIESGKMNVNPGNVFIKDLAAFVEKSFNPIAQEKNLDFEVVLKEGLPDYIYSDEQRLQQVLTNLLSNAFKFTHQGKVTLKIDPSNKLDNQICFAVTDTGIGIPKQKLEFIFQAFQQADGTTSRKYGGTGLGLSISREIAALLGGEINVESEVGKGSTFTFCVGNYYEPDKAINDALKEDEAAVSIEDINNVPEQKTSECLPVKTDRSLYTETNNNIKRILIVDDDLRQRNSLMELLGEKDVVMTTVSTGAEAIEQLKVHHFDCIILDLGLSDITGFDLLKKIDTAHLKDDIKVFIYTGRDLTSKEELYLKKYAHTIIIKDSQAPQRLMDELELYLHSNSENMKVYDKGGQPETNSVKHGAELEGKKVLIVDDDARNVFALSSVLETYGMTIAFAENGIEGLELLKKSDRFDLILMDIMMPEMDGYETMSKIRSMAQYRNIPIIALTAKAMKEDREKCIEAGASDYITKPVNPEQLISLIKVWLYQEDGK